MTFDQTDGQPTQVAANVHEYLNASIAENTRRSYANDWKSFSGWCAAERYSCLPAGAATVAAYLADMADHGKKASTIDRARAAIRKAHEVAGLDDPTATAGVRQTLKGIRRTIGTAPTQKAPTMCADIKTMCATLPDTTKGIRDRALLLVGFAGAFRRAELVGIAAEHITETPDGIIIQLPKSKTDQEGKGRLVGIKRTEHPATCPVRALLTWITVANVTSGSVFRTIDRHGNIKGPITAQSVALVVKEYAQAAGLDPAKYSGHSLRAGLVTQAAKNKASLSDIMRQTGHRSTETVNRYIRKANIFEDNVSANIGL
jgi:site-specific recombinase XerD